ncbi:MAG: 16S rRNA pseudouridine(516) synthase, partial [Bacilli bacterium]
YDQTVIDLLDPYYHMFEPFPMGRLDKDTEGLLLISNDGKLAHNLLSPKKHVEKVYHAIVDGSVDESMIARFAEGLPLEEEWTTLPAKLVVLEDQGETTFVEVTIQEGKFHQIKRMFAHVGSHVRYLKRVAMGPISLDETLELGDYRELSEEEMEKLSPYFG